MYPARPPMQGRRLCVCTEKQMECMYVFIETNLEATALSRAVPAPEIGAWRVPQPPASSTGGDRGLSLHCDTSQGRTMAAACLLLHKKSASLRQNGAVQNAPVTGQKLLQSFVSTISFMYRYTHTNACLPRPCPRTTARTPRPFTSATTGPRAGPDPALITVLEGPGTAQDGGGRASHKLQSTSSQHVL